MPDAVRSQTGQIRVLGDRATRTGLYCVAASSLGRGVEIAREVPVAFALAEEERNVRCHVCAGCPANSGHGTDADMSCCSACGAFYLCQPCFAAGGLAKHHSDADCRALREFGGDAATAPPLVLLALLVAVRSGRLGAHSSLQSHEAHPDLPACELQGYEAAAERILRVLGDAAGWDRPSLVRLLSVVATNAHALVDVRRHTAIGQGLFPGLSLFNHACRPTAYFSMEQRPGGEPPLAGAVRTLAPLAAGAEATLSYEALMACPSALRRQRLRRRYFFDCKCPDCEEGQGGTSGPAAWDALMRGWRCRSCGKNGGAISDRSRQSSDNTAGPLGSGSAGDVSTWSAGLGSVSRGGAADGGEEPEGIRGGSGILAAASAVASNSLWSPPSGSAQRAAASNAGIKREDSEQSAARAPSGFRNAAQATTDGVGNRAGGSSALEDGRERLSNILTDTLRLAGPRRNSSVAVLSNAVPGTPRRGSGPRTTSSFVTFTESGGDYYGSGGGGGGGSTAGDGDGVDTLSLMDADIISEAAGSICGDVEPSVAGDDAASVVNTAGNERRERSSPDRVVRSNHDMADLNEAGPHSCSTGGASSGEAGAGGLVTCRACGAAEAADVLLLEEADLEGLVVAGEDMLNEGRALEAQLALSLRAVEALAPDALIAPSHWLVLRLLHAKSHSEAVRGRWEALRETCQHILEIMALHPLPAADVEAANGGSVSGSGAAATAASAESASAAAEVLKEAVLARFVDPLVVVQTLVYRALSLRETSGASSQDAGFGSSGSDGNAVENHVNASAEAAAHLRAASALLSTCLGREHQYTGEVLALLSKSDADGAAGTESTGEAARGGRSTKAGATNRKKPTRSPVREELRPASAAGSKRASDTGHDAKRPRVKAAAAASASAAAANKPS